MEGRSYMFSSGKKRSSQMATAVIRFAREDDNAPRMLIIKKECPDLFSQYKTCVQQNGELACTDSKVEMMECGVEAFRVVNSNPDYII